MSTRSILSRLTVAYLIVFSLGLGYAEESEISILPYSQGGETPEEAFRAFARASQMGDDEAALRLIDPRIQPLLRVDVAIEEFAFATTKLEFAMFGIPEAMFSSLGSYNARRELVEATQFELLNQRTIDDDHVVFTVTELGQASKDDGPVKLTIQYLILRHEKRWYVFRPIGAMKKTLTKGFWSGEEFRAAASSTRELDENNDKTVNIAFNIPIERLHQGLVQSIEESDVDALLLKAQNVTRFVRVLENRARRGEYRDRESLREAVKAGETTRNELDRSFQEIMEKFGASIKKELQKDSSEN